MDQIRQTVQCPIHGNRGRETPHGESKKTCSEVIKIVLMAFRVRNPLLPAR